MLSVPTSWIWDFWLADDGARFHIFYLNAPKSLGDPHRRHRAARIGHASSADLSAWTLHGSAFDAGAPGSFDETATWTGCVVRGDDGLWRMFYTGSRFLKEEPDFANIETVGMAVSADLEHWEKRPDPITRTDPRWYETYDPSSWKEEAWRDPWVFRDPSGTGWHMLVTARANHGDLDDRGVIGHAFSTDLESWEVQPPLSAPGSGFSHLEVPQVEEIDGQWVLLFSCPLEALSATHAEQHSDVGSWALPIASPTGPFDVKQARPITTSRLYSARAAQQRDGRWALMGFLNSPDDEPFPGIVSDPIPLELDAAGYPLLATATKAPS
ncbi:MAG: family 43 glycosylhydrolase [Sinomonas sp.]|nr:family 43 glycosylhydrolase [Sinomonas sp.]